ncbi:hypothetical protein DsansV1_C18g0150711 [Dioscorea sansibarensis]
MGEPRAVSLRTVHGKLALIPVSPAVTSPPPLIIIILSHALRYVLSFQHLPSIIID